MSVCAACRRRLYGAISGSTWSSVVTIVRARQPIDDLRPFTTGSKNRKSYSTINLNHPSPQTTSSPPRLLPAATRSYSSSSSSSTRWKTRQASDSHAARAKLAGLKSRAAFKLLEIDAKHHLFRPGNTVVDLGFAPGSWAQVAVSRTRPGGRVVGIDVLPAQPPKGVSTLQGDFLSPAIRAEVEKFVRDQGLGRVRGNAPMAEEGVEEEVLEEEGRSIVERERRLGVMDDTGEEGEEEGVPSHRLSRKDEDARRGRVVDVVLSDMSEPWPQVDVSSWLRSVSNPYRRMMNTSGMTFRDHAGSMDLCNAALTFSYDTLVSGGHLLCKFYDGAESQALELRLKKLFEKVHRIKPDASRKESREAYFVCLRRRTDADRDVVLGAND